jgi:hypothetical protein
MSWATNSVEEAIQQLGEAVEGRCEHERLPIGVQVLRTPVALMFVKGDRAAPGLELAMQVVKSFGYWDKASAQYLDLVFFGWWYEGGNEAGFQSHNNAEIFFQCCDEIANMCKWRYKGETDVLLVDFEMPVAADGSLSRGAFSFKNCIWIPVEEMIREKRVGSLDALVSELVTAAKEVYDQQPLQGTVFEVSDRIAWTRGRRVVWEQLKRLILGDWSRVYDELRPFAVCNLTI